MKIVWVVLALSIATSALAGSVLSAAELSKSCTDYEKVAANDIQPQSAAEAIHFGQCLGYLEGFIDALAFSQVRPADDKSLSPANVELAFRLYMNKHPDKSTELAPTVLYDALFDANLIRHKDDAAAY
jgi:Rap1a immunity proteins